MTALPVGSDEPVFETFHAALSGLGPVDMRVVHLAISQAVDLQVAGRGAEADALLMRLLRILGDADGGRGVREPHRPWLEN